MCKYAESPEECLREYCVRTQNLLHSWETFECTNCRFLRINGERVARPKDTERVFMHQEERRAFKSRRVCLECGGKIGHGNKSGLCWECASVFYGRCPE